MARKLFTVNVQTEILVVADDETQAEKVAGHIVEDEWPCRNLDKSLFAFRVQPMSHLPAGFYMDDFAEDPTFYEPELTIREWIELGAAPAYRAAAIQRDAQPTLAADVHRESVDEDVPGLTRL